MYKHRLDNVSKNSIVRVRLEDITVADVFVKYKDWDFVTHFFDESVLNVTIWIREKG